MAPARRAKTRATRRAAWRSRAAKGGLALVSLALALAAAEVGLRVWLRHHMAAAELPCGDRDEDHARLRYAYALSAGREPEMPSAHYAFDPRRGYKLAAGLRDVQRYGHALSSNAIGARGRREIAREKPAGVRRIVALGDSFTFGEGVADDETWPAQLGALLPDTEVVNLGASAYAHDQMYFALVDDALPLAPDVVVVGFLEADMTRNTYSFFCYEKPRFVRDDGGWRVTNLPVPSPAALEAAQTRASVVWALTRAFVRRHLTDPPSPEPGPVTEYILDRIVARTRAAGARVVFVRLPTWRDLTTAAARRDRFFPGWCRSRGVDCVDPTPRFQARREVLGDDRARTTWFLADGMGHPTAAGYRVVAEALRDHLAPPAPPPPAPSAAPPPPAPPLRRTP